MTKLVKKYLPVIENYKNLKKQEKQKYLKSISFAKCVCEICLNLIKGVIPLKETQKRKLRRHTNILRKLTRKIKKKNFINKKKLIQTGGSFLPLLFSIVAPILTKILLGKDQQ